MTHEQYFMINNAFGNVQCLLCYQTFKTNGPNVLKSHFDCFHIDMNKFNENEREKLYNKHETFFLEKVKGWLFEVENNGPKSNYKKLKPEISSLISFDIVRKDGPFSDGKFIKEILIQILQKFNYNFLSWNLSPSPVIL